MHKIYLIIFLYVLLLPMAQEAYSPATFLSDYIQIRSIQGNVKPSQKTFCRISREQDLYVRVFSDSAVTIFIPTYAAEDAE